MGPPRGAPKGMPDLFVSPSDDVIPGIGSHSSLKRATKEWYFKKLRQPRIRAREVARLVDRLSNEGHLESLDDYSTVMRSLASVGRWRTALNYMEGALERQLPDAANLWSGLISERSRAGAWETSLALLYASGGAAGLSAADFSGVLGACTRRRQWQWAVRLWEEARGVRGPRRDGGLDEQAYASAARALSDGHRWEGALQLLRLMDRQHLPLDSVTCQQAVATCQKAERWEHAIQLLGLMDRHQVPLDVATCSRVVWACQQARQAGPALDMLREMQRREISPGASVYESVIVALEQAASEERRRMHDQGDDEVIPAGPAPGLLSEMREMQFIPSQAAYHAVIRTHEMAHESGPALKLLSDMQAVHVRRDTRTYRALMTVCGKVGNWQRSLCLLDEMREDYLMPNGFNYDAVITACASRARWQQALQLFSEALSGASESNEAPYWFSSTTIACARAGKWQWALWVLGERSRAGFPPNAVHYYAALYACRRSHQWRWALSLLERMPALSFTPRQQAYTMAIESCDYFGAWEWAVELLGAMKDNDLPPSSFPYNAVVSACDRDHQWTRVLELFKEMQDYSYELDAVTYSLCMGAARKKMVTLVEAAQRTHGKRRPRGKPKRRLL